MRETAYDMQPGFDIEKYLNHSKKVDVTDLDFTAARSFRSARTKFAA
jgi:hypothetical protein